jgi:hypothetical protein
MGDAKASGYIQIAILCRLRSETNVKNVDGNSKDEAIA